MRDAERPSGTVTFVFTDIEGSTALWEAQPAAMRSALARHDELVRTALAAHGGYVFASTGDGVAAAFSTPGPAVQAALDVQRAVEDEDWPDTVRLKLRAGVHTGTADERDGDYFGPDLNRTARIMALADGGEVLISAVTAALVRELTRDGVSLVDEGIHELRGAGAERLFAVLAQGVTEHVQRPHSRDAGRRARSLPGTPNTFVGRAGEMAALLEAVRTGRMTTLVGPGGVGKTRLAVEVARLIDHEFHDGAWFVALDELREPDALGHTLLAELGVRPLPGQAPVDALAAGLHASRRLIVLDNCEHLLAAVAAMMAVLLDRCPTISLLATSRAPLAIRAERVWPVDPLGLGDAAVALFVDRASASGHQVVLADDRPTIAALCRRLDGMPLAIELAASRARTLSPSELLARLDDRFRLLRSARPATADAVSEQRHATLVATVDWSYQLLDETSRTIFGRLGTFAGAFDLDAAIEVCTDDEIDELGVIDTIETLVDHSLVTSQRSGERHTFRLLETMRAFALGRLDAAGSGTPARRLHARWVSQRAAILLSGVVGRDPPVALQAAADLELVWPDLRAAVLFALGASDVELSFELLGGFTGLECLWRDRAELGDWVERALALAGAFDHHNADHLAGIAALFDWRAGRFESMAQRLRTRPVARPHGRPIRESADFPALIELVMQDRLEEAERFLDELLVASEGDDDFVTGICRSYRAVTVVYRDPARAIAILDQVDPHPNPLAQAAHLYIRGIAEVDLDAEAAIITCREVIDRARACGATWFADGGRVYLLAALSSAGGPVQAVALLHEVLDRASTGAGLQNAANIVRSSVILLDRLGRFEQAVVCAGWLDHQDRAVPPTPGTQTRLTAALERCEQKLQPPRTMLLRQRGQAMTAADLVAYLRNALDSP